MEKLISLPSIEVMEGGKIEEIYLTGDPFFYFRFEVNDHYLWCDYDYPERKLTSISYCMVSGPVVVHGKECLEVHCRKFTPGGEYEGESFYYAEVNEHGERGLLFIRKDKNGRGVVEEIDEEVIKRRIRKGEEFVMREEYTSGEFMRRYESKGRIEGPFRVKLGEKEYETLRITKWSENELAEVYVDGKTGLTVLFRRYNGPGWDNYEELPSSPGREIEGIHFRLWYDSIPVRDEEAMRSTGFYHQSLFFSKNT